MSTVSRTFQTFLHVMRRGGANRPYLQMGYNPAMSHLTLTLFGTLHAVADERPLRFSTDKVRALLAYLAMEPGRPHRREALATLLWPEQPDSQARKNLRLTLHRLRQALDIGEKRSDKLLTATRAVVQWEAGMATVDYTDFIALLTETEAHDHRRLADCDACMTRLETAVSLLRGDLLSGLSLSDAEPFEEWLLVRREFIHHRALRLFAALADGYEARADYARALDCAQRQLALEPWYEAAHRQAMRALALNGDRDRALAQFETCRAVLSAELGVEPVSETAVLHQQIRNNSLSRQPQTIPLHHMPADLTPFIGRDDELERISALLADENGRLLTLLGPGGMGKTRLAVQAARRYAAIGPHPGSLPKGEGAVSSPSGGRLRWGGDAIYFVPLETAVSIPTALPILAEKLGVTLSGDGDPQAEVVQFLRGRRCLLILDNLEQFADAAALVGVILQAAPHVKIVATSRQPLGLRAERRLPLDGLPEPAAIALFTQSARQLSPHFHLDEATKTAVSALCKLVNGLPLALELAAGWVRVMEPAAILREAEKSLTFLAAADHDRPERHRSLQAIFNQTWEMLSPHLRRVLAQTAVFPADFTLSTLQAILPDSSMLDMAVLLDKSLLRRAEHNRYALHPLIKQFAAAHAGDEEWKRPFCNHYLTLATAQETEIYGAEPQAALRRMQRDLINLGWAWTWASESGLWVELYAAMPALVRFFQVTGQFSTAVTGIERALTAAATSTGSVSAVVQAYRCQLYLYYAHFLGQMGQYNPAIAQAETALAMAVGNADLTAQAHASIGEWRRHQGQYGAAMAALTTAISLFGERQSSPLAAAHNELGFAHLGRGDYVAARVDFQTALALYEALDDVRGTAVSWGNLGYLARLQADYGAARDFLGRALTMAQAIGDRQEIIKQLLGLSWIALQQGEIAQSQSYQQEALTQAEAIGYLRGVLMARRHMADTCLTQNRLDEAEKGYRGVLALARPANLLDLTAHATGNLGIIYARRGEFETAVTQYETAVALCQQLESPVDLHRHLSNLGGVQRRVGQFEAAQRSFTESLKIARRTGNRQSEAGALIHLGAVCRKREELKLAGVYFAQAQQIYEALEDKGGLAKAHGFLGLLHQDKGEFEAAIAHFEMALAHSEALADELTAAVWRKNLAEAYFEMGEGETAVSYNKDALACFRKLNSKLYMADGLQLQAQLLLEQGQPEAARLAVDEALALAEAVGEPELLTKVRAVME